jgi:hypothetical protein
MKENKFKPGDVVMFTGPYLFRGESQPDNRFDTDIDHVVQDHSPWQDQWEDHFREGAGSHVILNATGSYANGMKGPCPLWVDEDCLDYAFTPVSDSEVEDALESIRKSLS